LAEFKAQIANAAPQKNQEETLEKQFKSLERKIQLFRARPITVLLDTAAPEHGFNQQFFSFQQLTIEKIIVLNQQGKRVGTIDIKASRFPLTEIHDWSWLKGQLSIGFRFSFLRRTMNLTLAMAKNISLPALQKAQQPPSPPAMVQYLASDDFNEDIQRLIDVL
jgi:DNA helicase-2/ATP-dependent DNA helicase PcrA